uniref:Vacuolar protein sorting-associated protein 13 VPS13 adaptor binding domain-containing protein n=1 Tax=Physcomitrium patens TaxID=3218 RepID=A0A2K1K719_PHYPA|nr:hypothetical protein PHYPA_011462 [Physcomitrium patens]
MGLLSRLEHEVVKRLKPFLAHGQDASLKITPSTSQLRVRLRDVSLDVAALNEAAMSTTSLLVHEVVIEEADLKLSLLSFPMWTVIVRGIHIVVKPRLASEPRADSGTVDQKTELAREGYKKTEADAKQGKESTVTSFFINSLANFFLSSLRVELHNCSVKFVSQTLKPSSYVCSASLESFTVQEGSADDAKPAEGLFQAFKEAVRNRFERRVGSVKKMCIFRGLALNLEIVTNSRFALSGSYESFGKRHRNSSISKRNEYGRNSLNSYVCDKRDQILLFEVVSLALRLRGIEYLGVVVEVPEVLVGLDARELDVLLILAAQANGAGVRETDKALELTLLKTRRSLIQSTRNGPSNYDFRSHMYTKSNMLEDIDEPSDGVKSDAATERMHQEGNGKDSELGIIRVPAHRLFPVLAWQLWVHSLSEFIGFWSHLLFVIFFFLLSSLALVKEAWQLTVGAQRLPMRGESELPGLDRNNSERKDEKEKKMATLSSEYNSESSLFQVVENRGPTFEVYFSRGLFTLVCTADDDIMDKTDQTAGEWSESVESLDTRGVLKPGVHMILERVSLEYGLDHIGSGGRFGVGHWQVDLISVVASQSLHEDMVTLRHGRWKKKRSDTLHLLTSTPYKGRIKGNDRCNGFQDIGDVPQTATARTRHFNWQECVAKAWSQHVWKCPENFEVDGSDLVSPSFTGDVSRAFLIAEFGTADVGNEREKGLGGLMTCALSMGCLNVYSDSTTSYRIRPLLDQLSNAKTSSHNVEPDKVAVADSKESEISYEEIMLNYINLCRHYVELAVPKSHVEIYMVVESSKFTFAATMGQFEDDQQAKVADADGIAHSSRGSSLVVEIGSLQLMTWPASSKEALSKLEARVPVKDAAPLGWWDECVDEKLWLRRPPTPDFPAETLGSEEEQVGNNLYFAFEDAGVMLRTDRNRKTTVPVLGPISCRMQSSFCRDNLYSQKGVIKSAAVSLEGRLAPFALHLYLEEMTIFQEIIDFGNALLEGFGSPSELDEKQPGIDNTSSADFLRNTASEQHPIRQTSDPEVNSEAPAKILFVLFLNLQLEAIQIVLGDRRINGGTTGQNATYGRVSSSHGRQTRIHGDGRGGDKTRFPGQGRYCYFATLPISLDMSVGDGYATQVSFQLNGAHMGVVKSQLQKADQQQSLYKSLLDGTVLDVMTLFQISETGFALDCSKIVISGPKLLGQVNRQSSLYRTLADSKTHSGTSLAPANAMADSSGKDSASHQQEYEHEVRSMNGSIHNNEDTDIESSGNSRGDELHWIVVSVDVGSVTVTDDLREALGDKIVLLVTGSSTLHIKLKLGKDSRNFTLDVEGGLVIIQTSALHSLFEYVNAHIALLSGPASSSRSNIREFPEVSALQKSYNVDGPSSSLKTTGRSVSLPPWATTKKPAQMRRLVSAPRRMQVATELMPEVVPKKGFDGNLSADLVGLSLVLVQRGTSIMAPVEGFIMEVDTKAEAKFKHGSVLQISAAISRASIFGLQGRTFGRISSRSTRTPQFRYNFSGASTGNGGLGQSSHRSQPSSYSLTPSSSGMSEDGNDEYDLNEQPVVDNGAWKPFDESHSYILERLSITAFMEKVPADNHPDFWKWRNSWKGSCSVVGLDFAITTSEVQLLLNVTAPLSGLSSSSSTSNLSEPDYEFTKSQVGELEEEASNTESYLPDGAVIAIKDMNEHYYLAVEEKDTKTGTFRLTGVLHYSLVGDKALFKVKYQKNKNEKTKWFSLLSLHAADSNGEPYRVHFLPGSGLAEVATTPDKSLELWECIEVTDEKSEGNEELGFQIRRRAFHLVNRKSKCGLSLVEGSPMLVKRPGSSFKLRILAREKEDPEAVKLVSLEHGDKDEVDHGHEVDSDKQLNDIAIAATVIPDVTCNVNDFTFTLLHEASGGMHLLPLVRLCMQDIGVVLQMGSGKTRVLFGCSISFDYFQAQNCCWVAVINPIGIELLHRARNEMETAGVVSRKTPTSLFCRLRKVDIIISELSLDTLLFLIGALDLAGPYTLRHSPVLANRCQIENQTGLDLVCRFDHGNGRREEVVESWEADAFLIRHTTSRRDLSSAEVASTVNFYLQKQGGGQSSVVQVSLTEPGVKAMRTRLQFGEDRKNLAPGPILVVDVMRQSQGGVSVTVSPMVRIRNATGKFLELQCRRPKQEGSGAIVLLEDGDTIDDCMGSFDALKLEGELRKALTSFNVGNFLLSIRPASGSAPAEDEKEEESPSAYEWSDDVKGAKAVRVSNLFEKFQYNFKKKFGDRNSDVAFGTVFCPAVRPEKDGQGLYFLIRTSRRQVPVKRLDKDLVDGKPPIIALQEQQELLLLPTIRIFNLFTSNVSAKLFALAPGMARGKAGSQLQPQNEVIVTAGKMALMYADLGVLSMVIKHQKSGLTSKQIPIFGREMKSPDASIEGGSLREMELDVDFGDGAHYGKMIVRQGDDGVLEVVLYTKYAFHNDSHVPLLYCAPKQKSSYLWRRGRKSDDDNLEWPSDETASTLQPGSRVSWFNKSSKVMFKQVLPEAQPAILDLYNLAGSTEISLKVSSQEHADQRVQLGVELQLPAVGDNNPTSTVHLAPRYVVVNKSKDVICVCQDGFQNDTSAVMVLNPGEKTALHYRVSSNESDGKSKDDDGQNPFQAPLSVRFRLRDSEWDWSGSVCAAALGSFWIKIRRKGQSGFSKQAKGRMLFALAEVQEDSPTLIMSFRKHSADSIPYRIENALRSGALSYSQKGLTQKEVLEPGASVSYVWDDLALPHKLVVTIQGTQLCHVINMDKIREWKRFGAARRSKVFEFQLPFLDDSKDSEYEGDSSTGAGFLNVGYEVAADGPTRVLRVCLDSDANKQSGWQTNMRRPKTEVEVKVPLFYFTIVEPLKQRNDASADETEAGDQTTEKRVLYAPIIAARITNLFVEGVVVEECTLCQLKVERLDVDVKWQGSVVKHMLRVHGPKGDDREGQTVLHMACVVAHRGTNPIQLHYLSILLQAVDLNIDEDTLMKLAPFYRTSLAPSTGPSRLIYYERFEIHPIKILASFTPGSPRTDYTSAQETLRGLLHTVIKVPSVRGFKVELNGVLLSNALLTYAQLAVKCAQHYSWYAMRAIYIARGSSLLPPAFASLFDDSAASSLDVFFDPSNGSVDVQGLTLGMFNILSKGLRKKGQGGTSRLLGDVEHTVKAAGSNILFAVVTEISDSVLKGAETSGLDGLLSGFRRGILNVAMRPAVLRSAVAQGGATRRIKLDHTVGMDEVLLRNLPPNTSLMEEILSAVKKFLIAEGLLAGDSSLATARPTRRLQGDNERRLGPAMIALCEQLLVVIAVQGLRKQATKYFHFPRGEEEKATTEEKAIVPVQKEEPQPQQENVGMLPRVRHAATNFVLSSGLAYLDGRLCRHIPNTLVRRIVSGFLLSFVE